MYSPPHLIIIITEERQRSNLRFIYTTKIPYYPSNGVENRSADSLRDMLRFANAAALYTPISANSISFSCDGAAIIDVEKYDLEV